VIPVSGLAAGLYLAVLTAAFWLGPGTALPVRRLAAQLILLLTWAAAGSALWFVIVQKWLLGAFCPYCTAAHIVGLLLAGLATWWLPKEFRDRNAESLPANPTQTGSTSRFRIFGFVGLALTGVLVLLQVAFRPPAAYRDGHARHSRPLIDSHTVPLVGSPDAPYVVILLFDYKCPHCQQMHFMLGEAIRRYSGKLAFALCPAPLDPKCNPHVAQGVEEFKGSCELAKVSLAVWLARREAFPEFDRWMFSLESGDRWRPRSLEAARAKAVELVGQTSFDAARAAPWIDQYLQTSLGVYSNTITSGNSAIPKLVFGSRWAIPKVDNADDLLWILHDRLAVPKP
jgi:hypothetical protein